MGHRALPNSPEALRHLVDEGRIPARRVWGMLALRSALAFALLLALAAVLGLSGRDDPVSASAAAWLWFATAANVAAIALMVHLGRREGLRLRDLYFADRSTWRGDLLWLVPALLGSALLSLLPGTWLATVLWGDSNYPNDLLIQPLPLLTVYPLFLLMPVTQAFAELPLYWGYVAPRLRAFGMSRGLTILIVGATLSVQHLFFALQLDWRYDLWLALKFLPFALWMGFIVDRRPTVLPYLMGMHLVLDASVPLLTWMASRG
ncbi:MAG: hypothetical protein JW767_04075 [Thermoleophilia bacterium]|nr:hypothetical protein [Thermoleophilia bacterium]